MSSTRNSEARSMMPPAARTGTPTAAMTCGSRSANGVYPRRVRPLRCPERRPDHCPCQRPHVPRQASPPASTPSSLLMSDADELRIRIEPEAIDDPHVARRVGDCVRIGIGQQEVDGEHTRRAFHDCGDEPFEGRRRHAKRTDRPHPTRISDRNGEIRRRHAPHRRLLNRNPAAHQLCERCLHRSSVALWVGAVNTTTPGGGSAGLLAGVAERQSSSHSTQGVPPHRPSVRSSGGGPVLVLDGSTEPNLVYVRSVTIAPGPRSAVPHLW